MMKRSTLTGSMVCLIFAMSMVIGVNASRSSAQDVESNRDSSSVATTSVQSLDDVRKLNAKEESMIRVGVQLPPNPSVTPSNTATKRQRALNKVRELQTALAGEGDRAQMEQTLREALNEFFLADMQYRVEELDKIKSKVRETEATLQKRLDQKNESIDLQVKLLFQEADGLSVFGSTGSIATGRSTNVRIGVPYDAARQISQQPAPTSK
jgi:hypothetical protein